MQQSNYSRVAKKASWNEEVGKNPGNLLEQEVLCNSLLLLHILLSVGLCKGKQFGAVFFLQAYFSSLPILIR